MRVPADYCATHRLADGTEVRLRLLGPADRERLLAAFDRLSPESRYRRFFTVTPRLPEKLLRRLLDTDGWNHFAIGAETATEDPTDAEGVGVARFIRLNDAPDVAEAAVTVVDAATAAWVSRGRRTRTPTPSACGRECIPYRHPSESPIASRLLRSSVMAAEGGLPL